MKKYDFLVVDAGLFGSVCAYELTKKSFSVLAIEKRNHIAGNMYTEKIENINVHKYDAHIFHTSNKEVCEYINQFAEFNNYVNSSIARYKDETYNLPFNMNTFSKLWSDVFTPEQAKIKIEKEKEKYHIGHPKNLGEQAINLVGITIYEKLVKGYTTKQWGKKCSELPSFIIRRIPVRFTYDNNYFSDKYQGIPIGGYTKIVKNMINGIEVKLNCDFFESCREFEQLASKIIYTGPIDQFFEYKFGALEYRSIRFENEVLGVPNFQGVAVVNYTESQVPYTRIIEHKHFEFNLSSSKTIISKEYSLTWKSGEEPYYQVNNVVIINCMRNTKKKRENYPTFLFVGDLANTSIMIWTML